MDDDGRTVRGSGLRIVLAPDKFKGSASAPQVADRLAAGIGAVLPGAEVLRVPVADGGDGTVDAVLGAGFRPVTVRVTGPLGDPVEATFGLGDGHALGRRGTMTAVVELAAASGLETLSRGPSGAHHRDALRATSRGTGDLLRAALDAGAGLVVLGVGGSASTDGGAGMLSALGVRLTDARGRDLPDGGGSLVELASVDLTGLDPRLGRVDVVLASDVDNPLLGARGAAAVFAPQKGATPEEIVRLETGLTRWRDLVLAAVPSAAGLEDAAGAGAAGGVGYAALAVLRAPVRSGIDLVLELVGLEALVARADLVVTGEGSLDEQSLGGKAPVGVARLARRHHVPVVAVCGRSLLTREQAAAAGFDAVFVLTEEEADVDRCIADPEPLLERTGRRIALRLLDRQPVPSLKGRL